MTKDPTYAHTHSTHSGFVYDTHARGHVVDKVKKSENLEDKASPFDCANLSGEQPWL